MQRLAVLWVIAGLLLVGCNTLDMLESVSTPITTPTPTPVPSTYTPSARSLTVCDGFVEEYQLIDALITLEAEKNEGATLSELIEPMRSSCDTVQCLECAVSLVGDAFNIPDLPVPTLILDPCEEAIIDDGDPCTFDTCYDDDGVAEITHAAIVCSTGVCHETTGYCVECNTDADCGIDDACNTYTCSENNTCLHTYNNDVACGEGFVCENGVCIEEPESTPTLQTSQRVEESCNESLEPVEIEAIATIFDANREAGDTRADAVDLALDECAQPHNASSRSECNVCVLAIVDNVYGHADRYNPSSPESQRVNTSCRFQFTNLEIEAIATIYDAWRENGMTRAELVGIALDECAAPHNAGYQSECNVCSLALVDYVYGVN